MTYAPKSLSDARDYIIRAFGVAPAAVGIVGDPAHRGGYHCGRDRTDAGDYSVAESGRDRRGWTNAASALDVGSFTKGGRNLRHFSAWLAAECARGAPDTLDIREVIYSPDGRTVRRWDRLKRRTTGDSSHLWHTHISYFRDSEGRDKTALYRRYIEGDDMDLNDKVELGDWVTDRWDDLDDTISVNTALGSAYGHARSAKEGVYKGLGVLTSMQAQLAALTAAVTKLAEGTGADPEAIKEAAEAGARAALADLGISWSTVPDGE